MSRVYRYSDDLSLYVKDRVKEADAARQKATAQEILGRFIDRPGVVLADEVGMGKTFVALSVASSIILNNPKAGPVIVMVPPSLKYKWPRDWDVFKNKCITTTKAKGIIKAYRFPVESGVKLLSLLDDKPLKYNMIFVTHGALSRGLTDPWVKLALIRRAFRRPSLSDKRRAFPRFASQLLLLQTRKGLDEDLFERLLAKQPSDWKSIMQRKGLNIEDDLVPSFLIKAIRVLHEDNFNVLADSLRKLPVRKSSDDSKRLKDARKELSDAFREIWQEWITKAFQETHSPLLILDEAHHLKNPKTHLASLFHEPVAEEEVEMLGGALNGVFERMLFLTATPFQLGHRELFHVLERFKNITWQRATAPSRSRGESSDELHDLEEALDTAQYSALLFDRVWGRLRPEMLDDDKGLPITPEEWIHKGSQTSIEENPLAVELQQRHEETKKSLRNAEILLKRWVIRHTKPKKLSNSTTDRRKVLPGAAIKDDSQQGGLEIEGAALLPFLLAARATAISSRKSARALFAEGLASSYEAYINTRKGNVGIDENNNDDDDVYADDDCDNDLAWYLGNLDKALKGSKSRSSHQKVSATIDKAIELWHAGEKVLIFCHYRETGRALEVHLNQRVKDEIAIIVRQRFGIAKSEAWSRMKNIQKRFGDRDDRLRQETDQELSSITNSYGFKDEEGQKVRDIMRRYLSTPSFLARYFTAKKGALTEALRRKDGSGLTIREQFEKFCHFLAERCVDDERLEYIDALDHIRKGSNVRLANGETPHETRRRLLLAFNTPFYPEILIASSVLSEGVDLHLNCRYIIHHDLCWNPSTMEQRTGRIDRIGAKAEITQKPIYIYLPYIAATQDEKMYRVVRDRERWFKVIMGEHYSVDEYSTDKLAIRVPFPEEMAEELALKLGVFYQA